MKRSKQYLLFGAVVLLLCFAPPAKAAGADDFGRIVHHIETQITSIVSTG